MFTVIHNIFLHILFDFSLNPYNYNFNMNKKVDINDRKIT